MANPEVIIAACIAVIILGLGKGGLVGLAALATPVMALAFAPAQAAAILLPILIVQDVIVLWAFHRAWNKWIIGWMLPGATIGILLGYAFAVTLPTRTLTGALGMITLSFGLFRLWTERGGRITAPSNSPGRVGSLFGIIAGFTSQIAHAGGPPFQIWVLPRKLPHLTYLGTSTIFFATINLLKVPTYFALGEFTVDNLTISAMLAPLAIASSFAGIWIVRRINTQRFYTIVYLLMIVLGGKLVWDGIF